MIKIDKLFTVNNDEVKEVLVNLQLIDNKHMWNKILENDDVRNQIYAIIENVGGIKLSRNDLPPAYESLTRLQSPGSSSQPGPLPSAE